jgi:predicted outer membrane protein
MTALLLMFLMAPTTTADEAGLWSAIHLTAQAAIDAGSLAQSNAVSPEIRNLGKLVVRDAAELDRRLTTLAATAGIVLAEQPKPGKTQLEELRDQSADFDRKFLNFNYAATDALRKKMHDCARQTGNARLRDLIVTFDPIIKEDQFLSGWCLGHCVSRQRP